MTKRVYGQWAGNQKGTLENTTKCIEEVWYQVGKMLSLSRQCSRKRGHGPEGVYCRQHAVRAEKHQAFRANMGWPEEC